MNLLFLFLFSNVFLLAVSFENDKIRQWKANHHERCRPFSIDPTPKFVEDFARKKNRNIVRENIPLRKEI